MEEKSGCEGCKNCGDSGSPQWKKDFPIDWDGDHYVSRRERWFNPLTLGSAILAGANWIVAWIWHRHRAETFKAQLIGSVASLQRDRFDALPVPDRERSVHRCLHAGWTGCCLFTGLYASFLRCDLQAAGRGIVLPLPQWSVRIESWTTDSGAAHPSLAAYCLGKTR